MLEAISANMVNPNRLVNNTEWYPAPKKERTSQLISLRAALLLVNMLRNAEHHMGRYVLFNAFLMKD